MLNSIYIHRISEEENSRNLIAFWLWAAIHHTSNAASKSDCKAVKIEIHELCSTAALLLFKTFEISQTLQAGT